MKAIIAEKPSVAREIAILLGASEKKDGFLEGNGYLVTWAFGHLVSLGMPEDYGIAGFQKESLPILPDPFLLTVRKIKKDKSYIVDSGALKQLKVIEAVVKRCDSIIVATDAGREGELIFRYIYEYLKFTKPFERLWISSLTEKAIRQGFDHLKPGKDFDNLYAAAESRSRADWLVGINASQALTISAGSGIYSLGRVQTPTLALICKRYLENKSFVSQKYWQVQLQHRREFVDFKSLSKDKWKDLKSAENAFKSILRAGIVSVIDVQKKEVKEQAPLLFDLTALQKEANKKFNFSAEETLNIAQSLYEKKFITYPRTGSKYIPEDLWHEIPDLVRALGNQERFSSSLATIKWGKFNKHIVNDLKVTDHHGLLITEKIPTAISVNENAIYEMIAYCLLEAISEVCNKEITDIDLQVVNYQFLLKGCKILSSGWRAIRGNFADEEKGFIQILPEFKIGDELKIVNAGLLEKKTMAPVLYTEAGLLSAMETAGKDIEYEGERKMLQGIGIGTPATRAAIIETLFYRNYIRRDKKALIPTDKGLKVYDVVKENKIADVAMTAEWEVALNKIENNELDSKVFQRQMESYAGAIADELLKLFIDQPNLPKLICPRCKKHQLIIWDKVVKCPDEICNWLQFRNVCGVQLPIEEIVLLVEKGKTKLIKGMQTKGGKKFDAYIVLLDEGRTAFEYDNIQAKRKK